MNKITLRDLFNLSDEDIENSKIGLNMKNGNSGELFYEKYKSGKLKASDLYYNADCSSKTWKNGLNPGKILFAFIQLPNTHRWLLISVGKCTNPIKNGNYEYYDYKEIEKYSGFVGRLIIDCTKTGYAKMLYMFDLKTFIDKAEVIEILPEEYEAITFNGYKNVRLKFKDLKLILETNKYNSYKEMLKNIKGIYCITDPNDGKTYIGSAYGEEGIAQRWDCYKNTENGGNKMLIDLIEEKDENYFDNMIFTLVEYFDLSTPEKEIIERENYWKVTFGSRIDGLNKN